MANLSDYHRYLQEIDFSSIAPTKDGQMDPTPKSVGISLIDSAIRRCLGKCTRQYFFEYSLLTSTINPKTGQLLSFAGIKAEDPGFQDRVGKYVSGIINTLYPSTSDDENLSEDEKAGLLADNWFHNPEMFLFPTVDSVEPNYIHGKVELDKYDRIPDNDRIGFSLVKDRLGDEKKGGDLYFANLSYPRSIETILKASNLIIRRAKGKGAYPGEQLIQSYRSGASRLKAYYDRYFPETGDAVYDYVTFPILSTRSIDISNYYSDFFSEISNTEARKHVAGMGHFFLYFRNETGAGIEKDDLIGLFIEINKIISHIALNYVYSTGITLLENMRKDAVKAAIAQVMARNMSHNFGSHVLSNLTGDKTYKMVKDANMSPFHKHVLTAVNHGYNSFMEDDQSQVVFGKTEEYDYQLPAFFQYLKSRMDYLNEVTLSVTTFVTSRLVREDVLKELDRVRILLNTISGVGDFQYSFQLLHNGERISKGNDIRAAFPADILGCQSFYNIIENIIRNTAKHSRVQAGEEVVFTIDFKDAVGCPESEDYYLVEIYSSVRNDDILALVKDQRNRLNESILDSRNNLRNRSLGLLEMEASAAFLRQIDLTEIESENYDVDDNEDLFHKRGRRKWLNLLKPFAVHPAPTGRFGKKHRPLFSGELGYRFFVQKPKDILFVGDWTLDEKDPKQDKVLKDTLRNRGILFLPTEDFLDALRKEGTFPHSFVLLDCKQDLAPYRSLLSLRVIQVTGKARKHKLASLLKKVARDGQEQNQTALETEIWKCYCGGKAWLARPLKVVPEGVETVTTNLVVLMNHPQLAPFSDNLKIDKGKHEVWYESVPSLRQGKLPGFWRYSSKAAGKATTDKARYLQNIRFQPAVKQELFEAYHYPVIIIDERVQRFAEENRETGVPCWALHQSTNVFIPRHPGKDPNGRPIDPPELASIAPAKKDIITLDPNEFTEDIKKKLLRYINRLLKKPGASLLIHYGILERMFGGDPKLIDDQLNEWAGKARRVVVTSGRGAHSISLPDSVCFVNLSSVLYACNESRNKYLIYSLINQSRRKRS